MIVNSEPAPADLERDLALARETFALTAMDSPDRTHLLCVMAGLLAYRYDLLKDPADLARALSLAEDALSSTHPASPDYAHRLQDVANRLSDRFARTGEPADLDQALAYGAEVLLRTSLDSPNLPRWLGNHANRLAERYTLLGAPQDLDGAISLQEQALALVTPGSSERARHLHGLACHIASRFHLSGNPADLDRALAMQVEAVGLCPPGSPDRAYRLDNLAFYLTTRHSLRGDPADLDRAVSLAEEALALTPNEGIDRARYLGNLGFYLWERYQLHSDEADFHRGLTVQKQALVVTPTDNPDRAIRLHGYGWFLSAKGKFSSDIDDVDLAISHAEEALAITPADSPARGDRLNSLANHLVDRYALRGDHTDLERALSLARDALTASAHHSGLARINHAWTLASILRKQATLPGSLSSHAEQASVLEDALTTLNHILARTSLADEPASRTLATRYAHLHVWLIDALACIASDAMAEGNETLDKIVAHIYLAISRAKGRRLAASLEVGALAKSEDESQANELASISSRLDQLEGRLLNNEAHHALGVDERTRLHAERHALLIEFNHAFTTVQARDPRWATAKGFIPPPSPAQLLDALPFTTATLILFPLDTRTVAISIRCSDATDHSSTPNLSFATLPWPGATISQWVDATFPSHRDGFPDPFVLDKVLNRIGKDLAPVLDALLPRCHNCSTQGLVIVPTGPLHRLPLHAIPWPDHTGDASPEAGSARLSDGVCVTYAVTPDVIVLADRRNLVPQLQIGLPSEASNSASAVAFAPGLAEREGSRPCDLAVALALATHNSALLRDALTDPPHSIHIRADASRSTLIDRSALAGHGSALVATHGRAGGARSGLLLHPDPPNPTNTGSWISASDLLAQLPLDGTGHLQLLACSTHADPSSPGDDFTGLLATFLIRGARSVGATLWPVSELAAVLIGWKLAEGLRSGTAPSLALSRATAYLQHATAKEIIGTLRTIRSLVPQNEPANAAIDREILALLPLPAYPPFAHPAWWAPFVLHGLPV